MSMKETSKHNKIKRDLENLSSHLQKQNKTLRKMLKELSVKKAEDNE